MIRLTNRSLTLLCFQAILLIFLSGCSSNEKPKVQPLPQPFPVYNEDPFKTRQKIEQLEALLLTCYLKSDTITMDRLLSDDYTIGLPNGVGFGDKYSELEGIKQPVTEGYVLKNDTMDIRIHDNTAVVSKLVSEWGVINKKAINSQTLWTNVWERKDTSWQLVCSHGTFAKFDSL